MPLGGLESQPNSAVLSHSLRAKTEDAAPRKATWPLEELIACFCCSFPEPGTSTYFKRIVEGQSLKKEKTQNKTPRSKIERKGWVLRNKLDSEEQGEEAASPSGSALLLSKLFCCRGLF